MKFTFYHNNINVLDLEKSVAFYQKALGLAITREKEADDGSFKLVFLGDEDTPHLLELTWLRDMDRPYTWATTNSILPCGQMTWKRHMHFMKRWGCICFENPDMGIYFINDPDGTGSRSAGR